MTNDLLQIQEIKGIQIVETATREANNMQVNYINESNYEFSIKNEMKFKQCDNVYNISNLKFSQENSIAI